VLPELSFIDNAYLMVRQLKIVKFSHADVGLLHARPYTLVPNAKRLPAWVRPGEILLWGSRIVPSCMPVVVVNNDKEMGRCGSAVF
jgi:hypothetical protein